jgi:peptidoglycan/xylan/chitin deacetylase (PgdA/CDA1 family)
MKHYILIFFLIFLLSGCGGTELPPAPSPVPDEPLLTGTAPPQGLEPAGTAETTPGPTPAAPSGKIAYITVDDGPSRENTPAILDILQKEGIPATFFVVSHSGVDDIYKRIISEGHELANHSYSHNYKRLYNVSDLSAFTNDVEKMKNYLLAQFGYTSVSFRFPGGTMGHGKSVLEPRIEALTNLGYRYFDWDVSTSDTDPGPESKNPGVLANNVVLNTRNRRKLIILMHDSSGKTATVKALPIIIEKLKAQGYSFDVVRNY